MKTTKELESKAIDIKGKKYVLVSDRVLYFNENYPSGSITTSTTRDEKMIIAKAVIRPDFKNGERKFVGHSQAVIGAGHMGDVALEVAETSAVGRALAFMGIGVIDGIASADEMNKTGGSVKPQADDSLEEIGVCDHCGKQGIKAQTKEGRIFYSCPDWKTHKEQGERTKIVVKKAPVEKVIDAETGEEIPF